MSQQLEEILAIVQAMPGMDWSDAHIARLSVNASTLTDPDQLLQEIHAFRPDQGWAELQSAIWIMGESGCELIDAVREDGYILHAEFTRSDGTSLHIQPDGRAGWVMSRLHEGEGEAWLALDQSALRQGAPGRITYRIYWGLSGDPTRPGLRPTHVRFTGFTGNDTQ